MKFIDEVSINVSAGKGGHGCLSFRREKYVPEGGPDGGDGGDGGSVFFKTTRSVNTLQKFRYQRKFKAKTGQSGAGRLRSGAKGEDLTIEVPIGTMVYDDQTDELLVDMGEDNQIVCVAEGGRHGLGNVHFKSSVNQAPRKTTLGVMGESRQLRLELKLLADVGLVGLPNAGKSSLIRTISAAQPKVADYPFTTLKPHLGVVAMGGDHAFVVADVPGLIAGAAGGAGLGTRFLKHLSRTELLLHVVDVLPPDAMDVVTQIKIIEKELQDFGDELIAKPRWLLLNKIDLLDADALTQLQQHIANALKWQGPLYLISTLKKSSTDQLLTDISQYLQQKKQQAEEAND